MVDVVVVDVEVNGAQTSAEVVAVLDADKTEP